ncbi:MAG: Uma2 family endonuclease, partial [Gemmataceae bacterium]
MATPTTTPAMTADEFLVWCDAQLADGRRYELVAGEVVEMGSPSRLHGTICGLVIFVLQQYIFRRGLGSVVTNDAGL